MSEQDVNHIEGARLLELVQMIEVVSEPEWEHIQACDECREAFITLKYVIERSRNRPVC